ncbi:MAG: DNA recombination protein RmuC [Fibrobacter sp.]|nr:DNA recombination protein RmuC [Fibrobacter sp.]
MEAVLLLVGVIVGGACALLIFKLQGRSNAEMERANAELQKELQEKSRLQFEELATRILEEKSRKFSEASNQNIGALLKPLAQNLDDFKRNVLENRERSAAQHASLQNEIKNLMMQTQMVSQQANNLATALKGDSKVQGDWGEMILSTILERSGLVKDVHYTTQENIKNEAGNNLRMDVLVKLPDDRCIIIDSKVSLTAYSRYCEAGEEAARALALKEHLASVRKHVDELAAKKYEEAQKGTLDFVMMFVPVEPAYLLAIQNDAELWTYAYNKHILLVSPTNLIACIKLIADLWRREEQNRNALKIAEEGAKMYDKFVGFLDSFEKLGATLGKANDAYGNALKQLKTGSGNLVTRSQN